MKSIIPGTGSVGTALGESVPPEESTEAAAGGGSDCIDCCHCGRSKLRARAGVRVSLDLQQFFSDQRARAFMWAPYGRSVDWLSGRITRVFGLKDIALMSRGHVLPLTEPLLMLEPNETIQIVNMSHVFTTHGKPADLGVISQRTNNEISGSTMKPKANETGQPIQCNISTSQENISQHLTNSQGNNIAEHEDFSRLEHPTDDMETTVGSGENPSEQVSEELQRVKEEALRLLDEHYLSLSASKPVRRRRRRRRRPLCGTTPASDEEPPAGDAAPASQDAGAVLRNGSGSRPPRVIRALSPTDM